MPTDRPQILIVGDDMAVALWPCGFHATSLRRYLARCESAAIFATAPIAEPYQALVEAAAGKRQDVLIIETREDYKADWLAFLRAEVPGIAVVLATNLPAGRA